MRHRRILIELCVVGLVLAAGTLGFADVNTEEDVVFGQSALTDGETIDRVMDVHRPEGDKQVSRPALILLHGNPGDAPYPGGRQHGFRDISDYFVQRGYVCFVVAWDLRQGHSKAFAPIEMAVRHIRTNAKRYGIVADRIGVLGGSYGSRHACTLATANFVDKEARVQACVMWAGGMSYPQDCDPKDAPILMTYGTADSWYVQVPRILESLNKGNVRHVYFELEDGGHCFPMETPLAFGMEQREIIADFLAIHLKDAKDTRLKTLYLSVEGKGQAAAEKGPSYGMYPQGSKVVISASPAPGSRFVTWRGDTTSKQAKTEILMDSNMELVAVFAQTDKN